MRRSRERRPHVADELKVELKLSPHPEEITPQEMNRLLDGEITKFQDWVIERNKASGFEGAPLAAPERLIVKSYIFFAATRES